MDSFELPKATFSLPGHTVVSLGLQKGQARRGKNYKILGLYIKLEITLLRPLKTPLEICGVRAVKITKKWGDPSFRFFILLQKNEIKAPIRKILFSKYAGPFCILLKTLIFHQI